MTTASGSTPSLLLAVGDAPWEADLLAALGRRGSGLHVARRCVDAADLLVAAGTLDVRAAVVGAGLARLDSEVVARLGREDVVVVGVVGPDDPESDERRLRGLGAAAVVRADEPDALRAAVTAWPPTAAQAGPVDGVDVAGAGRTSTEQAARVLGDALDGVVDPAEEPDAAVVGRVVVVWGPTGAPGRTSTAVGVAAEAAAAGVEVLLVDLDVYGGVVAQLLGLLDESPGVAAACGAARRGALDVPRLAALSREVSPRLRVLGGLTRADRWPEVGPDVVGEVLRTARATAPLVVVDVGFCLEEDEELSYDTLAPRRNGATVAALGAADVVLAVGSGDPVGLQRLVRGLADLREVVPGADVRVVVQRLRRDAVPGRDAEAEVRQALARFAGVRHLSVVPDDRPALDRATALGRTLVEAAPRSPARAALRALAGQLVDLPDAAAGRRGRRGPGRRARLSG